MNKLSSTSLALVTVGFAPACWAYIGPGAGLSVLGALWGLILALLAALSFVLLWPLRRYRRQRTQASSAPPEQAADHSSSDTTDSPEGRH